MAKQIGIFRFERLRLDDLVFYKMDGQYYCRVVSSLTGKRVKTKPEFRKTMYYAGLMGRASKIGSLIYKALPENWRQFWMYREFTGEAMKMLKEGKMEEEIIAELRRVYVDYWEVKKVTETSACESVMEVVQSSDYSIKKGETYYKKGVCKVPVQEIKLYITWKVISKYAVTLLIVLYKGVILANTFP